MGRSSSFVYTQFHSAQHILILITVGLKFRVSECRAEASHYEGLIYKLKMATMDESILLQDHALMKRFGGELAAGGKC